MEDKGLNSEDLVQPVNNVGSQVSNLNSTVVYTSNEITESINSLNTTLAITNVLLFILVLVVIIRSVVNWRRKS